MTTDMALNQAMEAGRATDTVLGHLSLGEVVIPRALLDDPEVLQVLQSVFEAYGIDMGEFTVGDPANKINPETGYPEFFFKSIKKIFKKAAPIALPLALSFLAPGLGTAIGGALGAGAASAPLVGGAVIGAGTGALTGGGLKGALVGGLAGAGGSLLSGSGALGYSAGTPLSSVTGNALMQGPTAGTGLAGSLTRGLSGAGLSGIANNAGSILGAVNQYGAQDDMEEQLLRAQGKAQAQLQPYSDLGLEAQTSAAQRLQEGFDPTGLENDPGFQYRLSQGNEQAQRALAAQGMSQSGAAIKAAQELGQGLASQQYNDAYNQWLQQNQQLAGIGNTGYSAATGIGGIQQTTGDIQANKTLSQSNIISETLAKALGQRIIGYDPATGKPIYG